MRIYQAGPLFSEAEQNWHRGLRAQLEAAGFEVVWPGDLIPQAQIAAWGTDAKRRIFERCRDELLASDLVVALLDGTQVDDGTAWEIGCAYQAGKPVYGIRTDFRQAGECQGALVNCMIECSCQMVVRSVTKLIGGLLSHVKEE